MARELRWWQVSGSYAEALVAATLEIEAIGMAEEGAPDHGWHYAAPAERPVPPAPPTAPGLYAWFAE